MIQIAARNKSDCPYPTQSVKVTFENCKSRPWSDLLPLSHIWYFSCEIFMVGSRLFPIFEFCIVFRFSAEEANVGLI